MCGICGYVGRPDPVVLGRMRDALTSRGPDEAGACLDGSVALGHRRLAIVDLAAGQQPMMSTDGSLAVVFNGEIYNHRRLRDRLEALGHHYASGSDTETILHAYEAYGTDCPRHLDGMFAFVIHDRRRRLLFGARDRMGEKPLYMTTRPFRSGAETVSFAFASEIKALRAHPAIGPRLSLSRDGLVSYLLHDYVAGPQSIHEHVERLEPGGAFVHGLPGSDREGTRRWRYWELDVLAREPAPSEPEAIERLLELLAEAVETRLMADVPLGAFLSGGIDSSSVVALLTRFREASRIKTFSIGFDDPSFDESEHAERVARHFGTDHHHRRFSAADLLEQWPRVAAYLDEPFADPSVLPVSMLCGFAREHVTVALGGDGGDELFAGYDPFRAVGPARAYAAMVPGVAHRRLVTPLAGLLPGSGANMALGFKVSRFLRGMSVDPSRRLATWMGPFAPSDLRRLAPDLGEALDPERAYAPILAADRRAVARGASPLGRAADFFQRFYLPDDILVKVDRASMMHSLEVRSPFLTPGLVEFANALPDSLKLRRGRTKYLLKRALEGNGRPAIVPPAIVHRKKKGFGIPAARWIRRDLREPVRDLLFGDWPEPLGGLLDRREIERIHQRHVTGRANHYKELWALLMLSQWARNHLTGGRPFAPSNGSGALAATSG